MMRGLCRDEKHTQNQASHARRIAARGSPRTK
jgi:hypothetical protein